jgi:hypothetical protein
MLNNIKSKNFLIISQRVALYFFSFVTLVTFNYKTVANELTLNCSNNISYNFSEEALTEKHLDSGYSCHYINGVISKKDLDTRNTEDDLIIFRGVYDHCSMNKILIINPTKYKVSILDPFTMKLKNFTCKISD